MVRIGVYNEPFGAAVGGSEYLVAVLSEALAKFYEVELVHHRPELTVEELEAFSGRDLTSVQLRYVAHQEHLFGNSHNPWSRYQEAREWQSTLSAPYDLFIACLHNIPPFCHARRGVMILLFPSYTLPYSQPPENEERANVLWDSVRRVYHAWEWKQCMKSYQVKTAISSFSQTWARRLWNIDTRVIHPPAGDGFGGGEKDNLILSVGRFAIAGEGHNKRQLEMLSAFRALRESELTEWEYYSVGNLGPTLKHRQFFDELTDIAGQSHANVQANLERSQIKELFSRAKIFWHAAGYGEDEEANPRLAEHFGIATVEAMAAGCVPVVVNMGGQREIVEHGVSGYLWDDFDQLSMYTRRLAADESLRIRMSEAARQRARMYSPEVFQENYLNVVRGLLA